MTGLTEAAYFNSMNPYGLWNHLTSRLLPAGVELYVET